jgi:hypothetical protein
MSLGFRMNRHRLLSYCLLYSKLLLHLYQLSWQANTEAVSQPNKCQAKAEAQKVVASYKQASSIVGSSFVPAFLPCLLFFSSSQLPGFKPGIIVGSRYIHLILSWPILPPTDTSLVLFAATCTVMVQFAGPSVFLLRLSRRHLLLLLVPFVFLSSPLIDFPGPCSAILLKREVDNRKE